MSLPSGTLVGPYRIVGRLGAGGMGEVFTAQDLRLGRTVALKLLPGRWMTDSNRVHRFEREARAASALNHPNIITVHDILTTEHGRFIVTELVKGTTLRDRMSRGLLDEAVAVDIAIQVAKALGVAHSEGIVHRDIKPANIMVREDGVVKLLDFGIAKLTEPVSGMEDDVTRASYTATGVAIGTLRYMSPEQARGQHVDQRSDIFSLGVVLYEMLTGMSPFPGTTQSDVLVAILRSDPVPIRSHVPSLAPLLEHCVSRTLSKDVDERYERADDLRLDLQAVQRERARRHDRHAPPPEVVSARPPAGNRLGLDARRAVALGLSLIGLIALAASRTGRTIDTPPAPGAQPTSSARQMVAQGGPREPSGLRFVPIPGTNPAGSPWRAEFTMGCVELRDIACDNDERPQRTVTLTRRYALSDTEVTVDQFAAFLQQTGQKPHGRPSFPQSGDHPVVGVTWDEALAFCGSTNGRLPTEAEWEYAARAGVATERIYSWNTGAATSFGNLLGVEDGFEFTAPVAHFSPNYYGLFDMDGNAREWVSDWYAESYAGMPSLDPGGPAFGDRRVLRGGSWRMPHRNARLSDRTRNGPDYRINVYGFRCARDLSP